MPASQRVDFSTISTALRNHLANAEYRKATALLQDLGATGVIEHLAVLDPVPAAIAYRLLEKDSAAEVFSALGATGQAGLVRALQSNLVHCAFAKLGAAGRTALLEELPADVATRLLSNLSASRRRETALLLGYPEASAGQAMSPDFITSHSQLSVAQTLDRMAGRLEDCAAGQQLFIIDGQRRLVGAVELSALVSADPEALVGELCASMPAAAAFEPQADAARKAVDEQIGWLPLVDREEQLIGVLPISDAIGILEAAEEGRTVGRAGAEPRERSYLGVPLGRLVKARIVWLLVLAIGATLTVQVLASFERTLESMVVLSLFIPLIVGIGGNTGNQAATTVTRALAMGEVRLRDFWRVLLRELRIGATLGLCLGTIALVVAGTIFEPDVGLVIGISLVALCSIAAAVGGIMPIIGKFFKADPAVFSNPFISTFVDAAGLIVYLSVAVLVLG